MIKMNKSIKPETTKEIDFSLPTIERFKLSNGLEVYFIRKNKLPILQLNLIVNAGSFLDPGNKKGLSNLFSMVVDEGAGRYNSLELSDEFDFLGSNFSVYSNEDNVFFNLQSLKENFDRSLELFSDVILSPHFNETDFLREQRKVITSILQREDEPDEIADSAFEYRLFGNSNPYSSPVIGYDDNIKNISVADTKQFYSNYILPNNSTIIAVGNISKNELIDKLESYLEFWKPKDIPVNISFPETDSGKNIFLIDKKGSVQSEIRIGHLSIKRNNGDYFPRLILNTILGGQFTSRINLNLREKKGYTYGAHSRFTYMKESAYFVVSTSVGSENTGNAVKEIMNELKGVRTGVTEEEINFAKSSLIRKFPLNFETYKQIGSNLTGMVVHSLPDNYFNSYIENIKSISRDMVNNATEKFIRQEKTFSVIVGDKEKIIGQLKDIGEGSIIELDLNGIKIV